MTAKAFSEATRAYWYLGLTSFGGPGVHVGILRQRFVNRLKWVSAQTYDDLFALSNALPGPGSTQLAFSIAIVYVGLWPAFWAFLLWSIPASLAMFGAGLGIKYIPADLPQSVIYLLSGLNASAVGLILQAASKLARSVVTDQWTRLILLLTASVSALLTYQWIYPVLVVAGGLITIIVDDEQVKALREKLLDRAHLALHKQHQSSRSSEPEVEANGIELQSSMAADAKNSPSLHVVNETLEHDRSRDSNARSDTLRHRQRTPPPSPGLAPVRVEDEEIPIRYRPSYTLASISLGALIIVLVAVLVTRSKLDPASRPLDFFSNMLIAGVIIFGGGPVVIPLLQGYTVDRGWVDIRDFLLGFAILQAMPGPNFAFAVFLGTLCVPENPALGGFLGYLGIFMPGIMLKLTVLPIYSALRTKPRVRSLLRGLNAAAVGLIFAAAVRLWRAGAVGAQAGSLDGNIYWYIVAAWSFVLAEFFAVYPAICIVLGAVAGIVCWAVIK